MAGCSGVLTLISVIVPGNNLEEHLGQAMRWMWKKGYIYSQLCKNHLYDGIKN